MIKSDVKFAMRSLMRQPAYSFINILGLALGLTVCLLVAAYIQHELSFEDCHSRKDRIYRVSVNYTTTGEIMAYGEFAGAAPPLGPALMQTCPAVEAIARFHRPIGELKIEAGKTRIKNQTVLLVEPDFLKVFDVNVIRGDAADLAAPNTVFLTEDLAVSAFGASDPVGRMITIDEYGESRVAGILENFPTNTKIKCDALLSYATLEAAGRSSDNWSEIWIDYLYILLAPGADAEDVQAALPKVVSAHLDEENAAKYAYVLQPLEDIYLHSGRANELGPFGDITSLLLFGTIALITLVIAGINFVNLSTARTAHRAKSLGVRKVMGATRALLVRHLLTESLMVTAAAFLLALCAFELLYPVIDLFVLRDIDVTGMGRPVNIAIVLLLALLTGLAAGIYPAFYLTRCEPIHFLNAARGFASRKSITRRVLVVFQFAVAVILVVVTSVVYRQMQYSYGWDKGFDSSNVLVLDLQNIEREGVMTPLKQTLLKQDGVLGVAAIDMLPGLPWSRISEFTAPDRPEQEGVQVRMFGVDPDLASVLGIGIAQGRGLGVEDAGPSSHNIIVDEHVTAGLGLAEPLGATLYANETEYTVVGVMNNIHAFPTHRREWPLMMQVIEDDFRYVVVKLAADPPAELLDRIGGVWRQVLPGEPFEYRFLDDMIKELYGDYERFGTLVGLFSAIAVVIAGLGIIGLTAYAAERRRREVGIRKVVGASSAAIVRLLSSEFLLLVIAANILAWPLAWYLGDRWLQEFNYRVDVGVAPLALAGFLSILVALLCAGIQALRAANTDPVEVIRYE
ncbi:MAG: ABC transporter permease [candidate division Zixibacteria bacterium]|nr:ABC transporter permease [candidate division Zixibacteria bacterium]